MSVSVLTNFSNAGRKPIFRWPVFLILVLQLKQVLPFPSAYHLYSFPIRASSSAIQSKSFSYFHTSSRHLEEYLIKACKLCLQGPLFRRDNELFQRILKQFYRLFLKICPSECFAIDQGK